MNTQQFADVHKLKTADFMCAMYYNFIQIDFYYNNTIYIELCIWYTYTH